MIKIFHLSDIHLDSPFSLCSAGEAEKRRMELRSAFSSAVLYAKEQGTQLCFIAGDLFDSEYITGDGIQFISGVIRSYPDCRFFLSPGNHDPATDDSPYSTMSFPKNLHIFRDRERIDIPELNTTVYGVGFRSAVMNESPVTGWGNLDPSRINILVTHGDASSPSSPCGPITEQGLASSGFDYVALGHIHKPTGVLYAGKTAYCYPGCLVGRSYDEPGHHGAVCGTIEKGEMHLETVRFSTHRYETAECDLTGCAKYDAVDRIRAAIAEYKNDTILRLILTGTASEGFTLSPAEIGSGENFPYRLELIDKTTVKPVLSSLESDVSLKGVFCRKMQERGGFADGEDISDIVALAMKYGLSALEDRGFSNLTEAHDEQ